MLHYAFSRKMAVQTVIAANKEAVISEKKLLARLGQTIVVGYGPVIETSQFETFQAFFDALQSTWDKEWDRVFAADAAGQKLCRHPTMTATWHAASITLSGTLCAPSLQACLRWCLASPT